MADTAARCWNGWSFEVDMNILIIIAVLSLMGASVFTGIYIERIRWNNLIRDGILPRPKEEGSEPLPPQQS